MLELLGRLLWPLLRVGSLFIFLPVFTAQGVPARVRLVLAVAVTLVLAPVLPAPPPIALFSLEGFTAVFQQVLIGMVSGFVLQLVYAAIVFGGQTIALSMGLGFASLIDPQLGVQVPVVAQIYLMITTFLFLGSDGHLLLIQLLADSFRVIPIGTGGLNLEGLKSLLAWSGLMFSGGVLMALPVMTALLLVTLGLGVATRSAPQLNIFSVGFPITLALGMVLLWLTVPETGHFIGEQLHEGYEMVRSLLLP